MAIQKYALVSLVLVGLFYRIWGLWQNYSFWTDEISTARFAKAVLERGVPREWTGVSENKYYPTVYLTALFFKILGENELAARLPAVVFGTISILVVYLLAKAWSGKWEIGLGAAILTTFSYLEIAWSRQARGYALLQLLYLLTLWLILEKKRFKAFLTSVLAFFTHPLGVFAMLGVLPWLVLGLPIVGVALGWKGKLWNNVAYFHSFFWRQYPHIVILAILGAVLSLKKEFGKTGRIFWLVFWHLLFVCFFQQPFVRYVFVIFPIFLALACWGLWVFARLVVNRAFFWFLILFVVVNGNKFSLKPRAFYTLNWDMREIPEVDYKGAYAYIRQHWSSDAVVIETWGEVPLWYGEDFVEPGNYYCLRKIGKNTRWFNKEKKIEATTGCVVLGSLEDLEKVVKEKKRVFVVIEHQQIPYLPDDTYQWIRANLKLAWRSDRLPVAPDWDIWPLEVWVKN